MRYAMPEARYRDRIGDLISRAVVQKMILLAITKRLPVFVGTKSSHFLSSFLRIFHFSVCSHAVSQFNFRSHYSWLWSFAASKPLLFSFSFRLLRYKLDAKRWNVDIIPAPAPCQTHRILFAINIMRLKTLILVLCYIVNSALRQGM